MKKEVFLAIAIGFGLGLVITFGIWTANKSLKKLPQPTPASSPAPSPTPITQPTTQTSSLTITTPEDESLVTSSSTITLSGTASPNSIIAITYEKGEKILSADASGKFSTEIILESGYNTITVTAFDTNGNQESQVLTITYTTAKI